MHVLGHPSTKGSFPIRRTRTSAAARRALVSSTLAVALALVLGGGRAGAASLPYSIEGGTAREQAQVRAALEASSFDWSVLPRRIEVRIARGGASCGSPGRVYLDANLLDSGRFSWGVVQHEFAHQVDFLLLDDAERTRLRDLLGGVSWWGGAAHEDLAGERFASLLAWAYWPVRANVMEPEAADPVDLEAFRDVIASVLGRQVRAVSHR